MMRPRADVEPVRMVHLLSATIGLQLSNEDRSPLRTNRRPRRSCPGGFPKRDDANWRPTIDPQQSKKLS
jgi:hypothetical protein